MALRYTPQVLSDFGFMKLRWYTEADSDQMENGNSRTKMGNPCCMMTLMEHSCRLIRYMVAYYTTQFYLLGDHRTNNQRRIRSRVSVMDPRLYLHLSGATRDRNLMLESTQIVGPLKSKEDIMLSTRSLMSGYFTAPVSSSTPSR